jgi:hypothetical protein
LETENDLLQIKTLRELCNKANISMQEIFAATFKVLMEKVSNQADEEKHENQSDVQTAEKLSRICIKVIREWIFLADSSMIYC